MAAVAVSSPTASSSTSGSGDNRVRFSRGQLYAKGPRISSTSTVTSDEVATITATCIANQQKRDGNGHDGYHITIATKDEIPLILARLAADNGSTTPLTGDAGEAAIMTLINDRIDHNEWADIGLGRSSSGTAKGFYRVIIWPGVARFRAQLGLPYRHLHITLGFAPG
jgi:hypothetical protein